jgi:hypothetical protein
MVLALQLLGATVVPPSDTVLEPWVAPKFVPDTAEMVREEPGVPELADKLIVGSDTPPPIPSIRKDELGKSDVLLDVLDKDAEVITFVPLR